MALVKYWNEVEQEYTKVDTTLPPDPDQFREFLPQDPASLAIYDALIKSGHEVIDAFLETVYGYAEGEHGLERGSLLKASDAITDVVMIIRSWGFKLDAVDFIEWLKTLPLKSDLTKSDLDNMG